MKLNFLKSITAFIIITSVYITADMIDLFTTQEEPEEVVVAKVVDPKQLACMAKNIFYEAGGESILGQAAVA